MKRYGYLVVLGILALTLTLVFTLKKTTTPVAVEQNPPDDPIQDVGNEPVVFGLPITNAEIIKDYSNSKLMFNKTLRQWESHKAIDLSATEGQEVLAVFKGKVESIEEDYLKGTVITIDHGDGLKTVYGSLAKETSVSVGDSVVKGQKIGTASNTAQGESKDGAHLHFEVLKNNLRVNPNDYLVFQGK